MVRRIFLYCNGFRPGVEASRGDKISGIWSRGIVPQRPEIEKMLRPKAAAFFRFHHSAR